MQVQTLHEVTHKPKCRKGILAIVQLCINISTQTHLLKTSSEVYQLPLHSYSTCTQICTLLFLGSTRGPMSVPFFAERLHILLKSLSKLSTLVSAASCCNPKYTSKRNLHMQSTTSNLRPFTCSTTAWSEYF